EQDDQDSARLDEDEDTSTDLSDDEIDHEASHTSDESGDSHKLPAVRGGRGGLPPETTDTDLERDSSAVSSSDPLRRYLDEVRRYALRQPEEELGLVARMHQHGDMDAAKRLVQANLRLVVKIALEYRSMYSNLLDLIQEGNIGLMKAVSKFDPTKGARLGYY